MAKLVAAAEVAYAVQLRALRAEYDRLVALLPHFEPSDVVSPQPPPPGTRRPPVAVSLVTLIDHRAGEWLAELMSMGTVLGYRAPTESGQRLAGEIAMFPESYSRARVAGLPDFHRSPETRYAPSVTVTRDGKVQPRSLGPSVLLARGMAPQEHGLAIATALSIYQPDDDRARTTLNQLRKFEALCSERGTTLRDADDATAGACLASCEGRSRQSVQQRLRALATYWSLSERRQLPLLAILGPEPDPIRAQARDERLRRAAEEERRVRHDRWMSA